MNNEAQTTAARDTNLSVLTNATELVTQVILSVAGNDIANTIGGEPASPAYLQQAVNARMQSSIAPYMGEK